MRNFLKFSIVVVLIIIAGASCNKQSEATGHQGPAVERRIEYSLYTDTNFSDYNGMITFTLSIRDAAGRTVWDSVLAPMRVKDIPDRNNKIRIEKAVPGNVSSYLQVGFIYYLENVGISWFWDHSKAGEALKKVELNFR
ncbi:MAG: hypothetical protein H7Y27_04530 [Gemmatimonadaceae bacterium]|nr:hypothetical protein [Chitinophagaceae bacterium]